MQKRAFIELVAAKTGMTKRATERTMDALFQTMGELLAQGDRVQAAGFGVFTTKLRKPRIARNPSTGETVPLPETRAAVFKPCKALRRRVAEGQ